MNQILMLINIYLVYKIFIDIIPYKAIFWGLVVALFNPLYLWWACLRSSPEIYLITFVGLIIYISMKLKKWNMELVLLLIVTISISLLFKPALIFIPLFISCFYFFHRKYKLVIIYLLVFVICSISFKIISDISSPEDNFPYGVNAFMVNPFFTQSLLKSGKLGYYFGNSDIPESGSYNDELNTKVYDWITNYIEKNHNFNSFQICFEFFKENPGYVILSKILSPLYFISIADTSERTIFYFIINLLIVIFSIRNMKLIKKDHPEQIILITYIFLGYYFIFFLLHSCARYFIPISFYMCIFIGVSVVKFLKKYNLNEIS